MGVQTNHHSKKLKVIHMSRLYSLLITVTTNMDKLFGETVLLNKKHILLYEGRDPDRFNVVREYLYITEFFCGVVLTSVDALIAHRHKFNTILYIFGDVEGILSQIDLKYSKFIEHINVIKDLSYNYELTDRYNLIDAGQVPINIANVGVLFRRLFFSDSGSGPKDYYKSITTEHNFQTLGIAGKPGIAYRTGIYLTHVEKVDDMTKFKLLRCSTSLGGGTDNFRETDCEILDKANHIVRYYFEQAAPLNHVLAQTYHNSTVSDGIKTKEKKAKIAEHSDKTKDMPENAVMAFCSFYDLHAENSGTYSQFEDDPYDLCCRSDIHRYSRETVLTKLRFRLKPDVKNRDMYEDTFDITLYPDSMFLIPLSTNRLYTHEIVPSTLPNDKVPTRLGYVIRTSNTDAVFQNGKTYIVRHNKLVELKEPTSESVEELKQLYLQENKTSEHVEYDDRFDFSLNRGDYIKPII